jgi:hypothetical protein
MQHCNLYKVWLFDFLSLYFKSAGKLRLCCVYWTMVSDPQAPFITASKVSRVPHCFCCVTYCSVSRVVSEWNVRHDFLYKPRGWSYIHTYIHTSIHTYIPLTLYPQRGSWGISDILPRSTFYQNYLAMSKTADVTGGKPIVVIHTYIPRFMPEGGVKHLRFLRDNILP